MAQVLRATGSTAPGAGACPELMPRAAVAAWVYSLPWSSAGPAALALPPCCASSDLGGLCARLGSPVRAHVVGHVRARARVQERAWSGVSVCTQRAAFAIREMV